MPRQRDAHCKTYLRVGVPSSERSSLSDALSAKPPEEIVSSYREMIAHLIMR
jgi:hypothetical protein